MSTAWLYYNGAQAGMDPFTVAHYPIGCVMDQIACYQIARCGAKEKRRASGSLSEQMAYYYGR